MNESINDMQRLLQEVAGLLNSGTNSDARAAILKLKRIEAIAATSVLTMQMRR